MKNFIAVILCFFIISNHSLWAQWVQPTGPISGSVSCIFVSGNNVLAGIYDIGVCLSTDKGVNWKLVNNGLTDLTIYKIAIYNPLDKRIFLPKRTGLGLTLNFAHPVSTILMVALVLIIIISMIFPYKK